MCSVHAAIKSKHAPTRLGEHRQLWCLPLAWRSQFGPCGLTCAPGGQCPACTQLWLCGPAVCLQGAKLSRARVRWFKHNDMQSLEALLQQIEAEERATR